MSRPLHTRCRCPCNRLRCVDPASYPAASEAEQVAMVAEVGIVAALLDEKIAPTKADTIATALRLLPGLGGATDAQLNAIIARTGQRTRRAEDWLCEVTNGIRVAALRRLAFRLASMFCAWDGVIDEREQDYLHALSSAFRFSDSEAERLFREATGWAG